MKLSQAQQPWTAEGTEENDSHTETSSEAGYQSKSTQVLMNVINVANSREAKQTLIKSLLMYPARSWRSFQTRGYIFSHESCLINTWDAILMSFIVYIAVYAPLVLVFGEAVGWRIEGTAIDHIYMATIMDFIFLADVFVKARTSYTDHGYDVTDPKKILVRYVRSWFIIDFISAVPLGIFFDIGQVAGLLTMIRMLRIARLLRKLDSLSVSAPHGRLHARAPQPASRTRARRHLEARTPDGRRCIELCGV